MQFVLPGLNLFRASTQDRIRSVRMSTTVVARAELIKEKRLKIVKRNFKNKVEKQLVVNLNTINFLEGVVEMGEKLVQKRKTELINAETTLGLEKRKLAKLELDVSRLMPTNTILPNEQTCANQTGASAKNIIPVDFGTPSRRNGKI